MDLWPGGSSLGCKRLMREACSRSTSSPGPGLLLGSFLPTSLQPPHSPTAARPPPGFPTRPPLPRPAPALNNNPHTPGVHSLRRIKKKMETAHRPTEHCTQPPLPPGHLNLLRPFYTFSPQTPASPPISLSSTENRFLL